MHSEFQSRWSAGVGYVEEVELGQSFMPETFTFQEVDLENAVMKLKKPWYCDRRGIPPMALLAGGSLLPSITYPLHHLLASDEAWDDTHEEG